jgi:Ca2+-binding RTX toxin-like protein
MVRRRVHVVLLSALAAPVAAASLAWACAPAGNVSVAPTSAESGSVVSVNASGFPAGVQVDVRWNGANGQRLASGMGPAYTATFTVPAAGAGSYTIFAATADEHATHTEARAAFTVTGNGVAPPPPSTDPVSNPSIMNPFAPQPSGGGKFVTGTDGADRLVGTSGRDVIRCGKGDDVVVAKGGNDYIDCGSGNDKVDGGWGDDEIRGAGGNDTLTGNRGDDEILGGFGDDRLIGGAGADDLQGGNGVDDLRGNSGRDKLSGGAGRDTLRVDSSDRFSRQAGDRIVR